MALPKIDSFVGAGNFALLTAYDPLYISTNAGFRTHTEGVYASGTGGCGWTGDTFADDQYSEGIVGSLNASRRIGVAVHVDTTGTNSYYYFRTNVTNTTAGECISGTETDTSGSGTSAAVTDVLRLEVTVSGGTSTLKAFLNASEETGFNPWTSTALTSGDAGFSTNNGAQGARLSDWEGGDLAVGGETIVIDSGSYATTGTDIPLTASLNITTLSGTYSVTGTDVILVDPPIGFTLEIESGSYSISGTELLLTAGFNTVLDSGSYVVSGTETPFFAAFNVQAESGVYALTGTELNLDFIGNMTIESGSYIMTGTAINLIDSGNIWLDLTPTVTTWTDESGISTTWTDTPDTSTIWTDL